MLLVNIDYIPGKEFEVLGMAKGTVVQSKNFGKDFMAGMKTLVGGEITGYTEMLNEARQIAVKRMVDEAEALALSADEGPFLEMVGIEIPDDYTVIYKLSKSVPYFESLCTGACIYPLSQAQVDAMGVDGVFGQQPNNMWYNGPYVISEYVQNNSKIFTPNPEYWDKDCQLFDSVEVKMVQDNLTDDEMFMNGEVDRCDLSESRLRLIYDNENDPNANPAPETPYEDHWITSENRGDHLIVTVPILAQDDGSEKTDVDKEKHTFQFYPEGRGPGRRYRQLSQLRARGARSHPGAESPGSGRRPQL